MLINLVMYSTFSIREIVIQVDNLIHVMARVQLLPESQTIMNTYCFCVSAWSNYLIGWDCQSSI